MFGKQKPGGPIQPTSPLPASGVGAAATRAFRAARRMTLRCMVFGLVWFGLVNGMEF